MNTPLTKILNFGIRLFWIPIYKFINYSYYSFNTQRHTFFCFISKSKPIFFCVSRRKQEAFSASPWWSYLHIREWLRSLFRVLGSLVSGFVMRRTFLLLAEAPENPGMRFSCTNLYTHPLIVRKTPKLKLLLQNEASESRLNNKIYCLFLVQRRQWKYAVWQFLKIPLLKIRIFVFVPNTWRASADEKDY